MSLLSQFLELIYVDQRPRRRILRDVSFLSSWTTRGCWPHAPCEVESTGRLFCVGDIHGDIGVLFSVLQECTEVMDEEGNWIGGDATIVFCGDIVDRYRNGSTCTYRDETGRSEVWGDFEIPHEELLILAILRGLAFQARAAGGRVVTVIGNHEKMLLDDNTTFCSSVQLRDGKNPMHDRMFRWLLLNDDGMARTTYRVSAGDREWVMCHGGLTRDYVESKVPSMCKSFEELCYRLDEIITRLVVAKEHWMPFSNGQRGGLRIEAARRDAEQFSFNDMSTSPIWCRRWGMNCCDHDDCEEYQRFTKMIGVPNMCMVMGHCVQHVSNVRCIKRCERRVPNDVEHAEVLRCIGVITPNSDDSSCGECEVGAGAPTEEIPSINSGCNGRLWRIDGGWSRAFDPKRVGGNGISEALVMARRISVLCVDGGGGDGGAIYVLRSKYDLPRLNRATKPYFNRVRPNPPWGHHPSSVYDYAVKVLQHQHRKQYHRLRYEEHPCPFASPDLVREAFAHVATTVFGSGSASRSASQP